MLSSIHPLGERAKGNSFWLTAGAHVAASAMGGAALGAVAGAVGLGLRPLSDVTVVWIGAVGCGLLAGAAAARWRLPTWRRQVNEDWLTAYLGWVYGAGFGVQLGAGVVTIVTAPIVYGVVLLAVLAPSFAVATAIGSVFGVARDSTILTTATVHTTEGLKRFHRRMHALATLADRGAAAALLAAAAFLAVTGFVHR